MKSTVEVKQVVSREGRVILALDVVSGTVRTGMTFGHRTTGKGWTIRGVSFGPPDAHARNQVVVVEVDELPIVGEVYEER
jgi:hypothetical protein